MVLDMKAISNQSQNQPDLEQSTILLIITHLTNYVKTFICTHSHMCASAQTHARVHKMCSKLSEAEVHKLFPCEIEGFLETL